MPIPPLTADELIAVLKRSSLPTLLVEGTCDAQIYRHFEESLMSHGISTLSCGGRTTLLGLHDRQAEFTNIQVAFLADRDMWLFSPVPAKYGDIIWTDGYSIENDIYAGDVLEKLMSPAEKMQYRQLLMAACRWFAFCVEEYLAGRTANVAVRLMRLVPHGATDLDQQVVLGFGFREPQPQTYELVLKNHATHLRGKTLFEALLRILSVSNRASKYSTANLIELCIKIHPSAGVTRLLSQIVQKFAVAA